MYLTMCIKTLRSLINYDKDSGILTWKVNRNQHAKAGDSVGFINNKGYLYTKVQNKPFLCHRLAWALHYGKWPDNVIDHINRNKLDNRICNLRDVSQRVNCRNNGTYNDCVIKVGNNWKFAYTLSNGKGISNFSSNSKESSLLIKRIVTKLSDWHREDVIQAIAKSYSNYKRNSKASFYYDKSRNSYQIYTRLPGKSYNLLRTSNYYDAMYIARLTKLLKSSNLLCNYENIVEYREDLKVNNIRPYLCKLKDRYYGNEFNTIDN